MSDDAMRFQATVNKVQTLVDGGIRVSLDLVAPVAPETIVQLFDAKQPGIILEVAAVAIEQEKIKKPDDRKKHRKAEKNTGDSQPTY